MAIRIYEGDTVITEGEVGEKTLSVTGLDFSTEVETGRYQAVRFDEDGESDRVDIEGWTTLPEVTTDTVTETEDIVPHGSRDEPTDTLPGGTTEVETEGVDGYDTVTYLLTFKDDVEIDKEETNRVTTDPIEEVILVGTFVAVTGVSLSPQTSSADAGESGTRNLTATISPSNATNTDVSYSISPSTSGLSVSNNGLISWDETVEAGTYTTTVTTDDGSHEDTHVLTLNEPEPDPDPDPGDED